MKYADQPRHMRALYPKFHQYGISGTQLSGGSISGYEQNKYLIGLSWIKEAEEMLRTDPIVAQSWYVLKQTLLSATWRFKPGIEGDPTSEKLADFANEAFGFDGYPGQMRISFEEQLAYLLEFIPVGYRYAEEIYKTVIYFLKNPELIEKQLVDCKKTLEGIKSKSSSSTEAALILNNYLIS